MAVERGTCTWDNVDIEDPCVSFDSSKYATSDDERMAANSTDDDDDFFYAFDENKDINGHKLEVGMMFASSHIFKQAVRKHGCRWMIYGSKIQNSSTFQMKIYNGNHTCSLTFHPKQINSAWIVEYYENDIRINLTWPLASFQKKVINEWNYDVSILTISRAKKKVMKKINGKHDAQYVAVYDYRNKLLKVMPDSTIIVMTEPIEGNTDRRFLRMYICFDPLKKGFMNGCRPLLGLDRCHLKGLYGGQLLVVVGVDANDGMHLVAWAVVEAENNDS